MTRTRKAIAILTVIWIVLIIAVASGVLGCYSAAPYEPVDHCTHPDTLKQFDSLLVTRTVCKK